MGVLDPAGWMPDGMTAADKDALAAAHPGDPHAAAAAAWEAWAAHLGATGAGVVSVSTGAQSVTYSDAHGAGEVGEALRRAAWHRARARVRSVELGPRYRRVVPNDDDRGVIRTYDAGTIP